MVVSWNLAVIQTFISASVGQLANEFSVSVHTEVNVTLSTLLVISY